MRLFALVVLLGARLSWAERPVAAAQCDDDFSECKESCSIEFGTTSDEAVRAQLGKCLKKCVKKENTCREAFFEDKRNQIDDGTGAHAPLDADAPEPRTRVADQPDDRVSVAPKKKKKKKGAPVDDAPSVVKRDDPPAAHLEPEPKESKPEPVAVEPSPKQRADESDLRDDGERAKKSKPIKSSTEPDNPKKKEEKKRSLEEWDPEAL